MAMFGSKKEKETPVVKAEPAPVFEEPAPQPEIKRPRTLIGPGIKFVGNIEATEDIEINGRVEGNINSGNTITVTKEGSIRGDVAAENYVLEGVCEGNAKVQEFCKIGCDGSFTGELYASTLVTEDGSAFEGTLHLKPAKAAPVFTYTPQPEEETPAAEMPAKASAADDDLF
ncbi:MAG: polymer-forming cytoskeletal protein [Firmicutes bacterium]|nr:polymer-forming cytoskeletal protein [Bacillota bacterium]